MSNSNNFVAFKDTIFQKLTKYGQGAAQLGQRVRRKVFGFRRRSTAHIDRWAMPVKILHDHRLVQRRRAFMQSGGHRSGIALHAMKKARQKSGS